MEFTKMHGLGNDFVIVAGEKNLPDNVQSLAIDVCNRFFGIGADGLVYILPSDKADVMIRIFNSDGTEPEQCGNAVRCVAKYVYDHGLVRKEHLTVETIGAGVQPLQLTVDNDKVIAVRVDMGTPVLEGLEIPTTIDKNPVIEYPIVIDGREFSFTAVSMGNPHAVVFVDDAINFDLHHWGPKFESHPYFPRKINTEFVTIKSRNHVDMRVWERGAGPTLACGTGACATLVAGVLTGQSDRQAIVSLKGGDLFIEWSETDGRVYMTGPAIEVYTGTWLG
jgi:diaminopimelate epimerase